MERKLMNDLLNWKDKKNRKPLILNGARQVGKTWILKEFGRQYFDNFVYLNFDNNAEVAGLFSLGYQPKRLLEEIANLTQEKVTKNTLVIFDEVQECGQALTSLKYFCEETPQIHIAAAGSLLGLVDHTGTGFPVGKVDFLNLYPMSFTEFLDATGGKNLKNTILEGEIEKLSVFSQSLTKALKEYYVVGGMPEAVKIFAEQREFEEVREVQNAILTSYKLDISKHLEGAEIERVLAAFESIPAHLSRENKKFIFGHISASARARDFRFATTWLTQAGIAVKVPRISMPNSPLSAYADPSSFKFFLNDVGLLGAMSNLDASSVVTKDSVFKEFKGALTEQFVAQQLLSEFGLSPYYWSADNSRGEIDFLVQDKQDIFAVEAKAEENLKSKSLRAFCDKYKHTHAVRFSLSGYRKQDWMTNVPLYAIANKNLWK